MQKRSLIVSVVVILILGFAIFGFAQRGTHSSSAELGYYDRVTGAFTPLARQSGPDAELPPVAPTTGTLIFKFTITAKSPLPKNAVIGCSGGADISDSSGFGTAERANGIAALVSGTTYTCTATINYSWLLTSASTDKIDFTDVHASVNYGFQVTSTNGTAILVQPVLGRDANPNSLAPINVPANGATTTEDVAITL